VSIRFEEPLALALLAGPALLAAWQWRLRRSAPAIPLSTLDLAPARVTWRQRLRPLVPALRFAAMALVVIALARPQGARVSAATSAEGIDIVLALDTSSSMQIADPGERPRLEIAREALLDFIESRPDDRLALLAFRSRSLVLSPLTLDHRALADFVREAGRIEIEDGTAIGLAVADSLNLLREAKGPSRVVVLLTDGENNQRLVEPLQAARLAQALGVRLYTVGVVDEPPPGTARARRLNVDETALRRMAEITGGQYFRATDAGSLEAVYRHIGALETSRAERLSPAAYRELGPWLVAAALGLVVVEVTLAAGALRRFP
jgi:Ca-activated chloride channel family protein